MSMFTRTHTTSDKPEPPTPNPNLPAGHDDPHSPHWVHPDLRPHWGLDQDQEYTNLGDTRIFESWVWRRHMFREYERRVAEDGWLPDLDDRDYQSRLEHAGFTPPPPTPEDRPAYAHAVREAFAVERLQVARRAEEDQALQAAARWCELGRHSHHTTSYRHLYGVWVQGCDECVPGTEARVSRLRDELVNEDGVTRGERNDEWVASHRDELLTLRPAVDMGRIIAANMINAGGRR